VAPGGIARLDADSVNTRNQRKVRGLYPAKPPGLPWRLIIDVQLIGHAIERERFVQARLIAADPHMASISVSMRWRFFLMHQMLTLRARRNHTHNGRLCLESQTVAQYWFYVQYRDARPQDHQAERRIRPVPDLSTMRVRPHPPLSPAHAGRVRWLGCSTR